MRLSLNCLLAVINFAPLACLRVARPSSTADAEWRGSACTPIFEAAHVERRVAVMGSYATLEIGATNRATALAASEVALRAIEATETRLSTWTPDSELSRFNAAPSDRCVEVSRELDADLRACGEWFRATSGAFDPTVGGLVRAWDLRGSGVLLDDEAVRRELQHVGFERGCRPCDRGWQRGDGVVLEEGGFGKGVGIDAAMRELMARDCDAVIDLGGQVAVLGHALEWKIADPRDRARPVLLWRLQRGSIATSGNSENTRWIDGVPVGHILDPRTGKPAPDFGSASIWCESAAQADAFATAAFVMGPSVAEPWVSERDDCRLVLLIVEGETLVARADARLRGEIEALADDVRLEWMDTRDVRGTSRALRSDRNWKGRR